MYEVSVTLLNVVVFTTLPSMDVDNIIQNSGNVCNMYYASYDKVEPSSPLFNFK